MFFWCRRISEGLATGDCLVTVSTGQASDTLKEVGLAKTHAYVPQGISGEGGEGLWRGMVGLIGMTTIVSNLSSHDDHRYAVLEARQVGDIRLMLLKNPWSTSHTRWRGPFSAVTGECWTPRMREALQVLNQSPSLSTRSLEFLFHLLSFISLRT